VFSDLPANLAAFCRTLNRAYNFHVGPRELHDAARALEFASIGDETGVRHALRPVLCSSFDNTQVFDRAFRAFFLGDASVAVEETKPPRRQWNSDASRRVPAPARPPATRPDAKPFEDDADIAVPMSGRDEADADAEDTLMRERYSRLEGTGTAPAAAPADTDWKEAARTFVRQLETGRSRRWRPARRGSRFDLRRTLRTSLHTAGDVVQPRWRARTRRRPRFVVLIDGSRSMSVSAETALETAIALTAVTPAVETFAFSTTLHRITPEVRQAAAGAPPQWPVLGHAWGGGTNIGDCLDTFVREAGQRLLSPHTVVIIASDGLDTGAPDALRQAMSALRQRTAAVIWLNPLLESPHYEPSALGMRTARPYITTFTWTGQPVDLATLGRLVRLRR
jgi:uncharacterized protein with von Willebrand factor type A (vWA) domain